MSCSKDSWKVRFATWVARWNLWRSGVSVGGAAPVPPLTMGNCPVVPSTSPSPLVRQAARNLRTVEWLSENDTWRFDWFYRWSFWRIRRMMVRTPDEAAAWLPAMAFAISCESSAPVLSELAWWPLPEPLPPEAIPWRDRLIQVWEQYPAATSWGKTIRLSALVRLDRRVERLPEWLQEARQAMDMKPENRHLRLAALAGWRPRPGDLPAHGDSREAVLQWGQFWKKLLRNYRSKPDALIAATALLHLAEVGWFPSGPSPEWLREEVRRWVQQWETTYQDWLLLQMALASFSAGSPSPEQQDITGWLELTREDVDWDKRAAVWDMLAAWQRESVLERGGIGRGRLQELSLLPALARTLEWEQYGEVLRAMAGYIPGAAEVSAHSKAVRDIIARWEALSRNDDWRIRQIAWVARWNFLRAGVLTAEEQGRFGADYVEAIGSENNREVLLALAQITPPGMFPLATWAGRLSDQGDWRRLAARLAIHGWLVEVMEGASGEWRIASGSEANGEWRVASGSSRLATRCSLLAITRRQMRQVLRRAGQKVTGTVAPFVNIPREVLPDFQRLHEIETALAAGCLPPSPDAAAENRVTPRAVPARLPEAHPRTGPPGITDRTTGRTAGSEPPARHPFPEVIRHE